MPWPHISVCRQIPPPNSLQWFSSKCLREGLPLKTAGARSSPGPYFGSVNGKERWADPSFPSPFGETPAGRGRLYPSASSHHDALRRQSTAIGNHALDEESPYPFDWGFEFQVKMPTLPASAQGCWLWRPRISSCMSEQGILGSKFSSSLMQPRKRPLFPPSSLFYTVYSARFCFEYF